MEREVTIELLSLVFWTIFAISSGIFEAFLFLNHKISPLVKEKTKLDIHIWFNAFRFVIFLPIALLNTNWVFISFICAFSFPLWHDGFYYLTRNWIDNKVYPKRFFDESTTTSAKFSLEFQDRALCMFFSIILTILMFKL